MAKLKKAFKKVVKIVEPKKGKLDDIGYNFRIDDNVCCCERHLGAHEGEVDMLERCKKALEE